MGDGFEGGGGGSVTRYPPSFVRSFPLFRRARFSRTWSYISFVCTYSIYGYNIVKARSICFGRKARESKKHRQATSAHRCSTPPSIGGVNADTTVRIMSNTFIANSCAEYAFTNLLCVRALCAYSGSTSGECRATGWWQYSDQVSRNTPLRFFFFFEIYVV